MINRVFTACELARGSAKLLFVPQMHARFVAHLDSCRNVGEEAICALDDSVFSLVGEVMGVEVEDIVVLDAFLRIAASHDVPDGLKDAASGEIPVRQPKLGHALENRPGNGVGK